MAAMDERELAVRKMFQLGDLHDRVSLCADQPEKPSLTPDSLEMLLAGKLYSPFKPSYFLDHCETEHNAESFHFFYEVMGLRRQVGDETAVEPEPQFLITPAPKRRAPNTWASAIVEDLVVESAPHQINISSQMREQTLKKATQFEELGPGVFEEARKEVVKLMARDIFPRFAQKILQTNLSAKKKRLRRVRGTVLVCFVLLGEALCLGFFVPRWYLLLFWPAWVYAIHDLYSSHTGVCVIAGVRGSSYVGGVAHPIECPVTLRAHKSRTKYAFIKVVALGTAVTLFFLVLTWIIEAGLQTSSKHY